MSKYSSQPTSPERNLTLNRDPSIHQIFDTNYIDEGPEHGHPASNQLPQLADSFLTQQQAHHSDPRAQNNQKSPNENSKKVLDRFVFSKATKEEFGLKERDIPIMMREEFDEEEVPDLVGQNKRMTERYADFNTVLYLAKLKMSVENQAAINERKKLHNRISRTKAVKNIEKWSDFRARRADILNKYVDAKRR